MKTKILSVLFILSFAFLSGCTKDEVVITNDSADINYNAAYVINGQDSTISIINLSTNQVTRTIPISGGSWPHHINMNAVKTKVMIGIPGFDLSGGHVGHIHREGRFSVIDSKTGSLLASKSLPNVNHNAIFSPDDSEIWTAQAKDSGVVYIFNSNTLVLKDSVSVGNTPLEVTFSSDGTMAFITNYMSDNVTVIDAMSKEVMATIPVGLKPVGAWTGANNKMYVDNEEGQSISVVNVSKMSVEETISLGFTPGMAAYNSQLTELWVTNETSGTVVYFQRMGGVWMNMGSIVTGNGAHAVTFSNNGLTAYVTNQLNGNISVINTSTKTKILDIPVGNKPNGLLLRYIN